MPERRRATIGAPPRKLLVHSVEKVLPLLVLVKMISRAKLCNHDLALRLKANQFLIEPSTDTCDQSRD